MEQSRYSVKNLEQLLMQPPIAGQVVLGWDPAFRTGCKLAVVDADRKGAGYDGDLSDSAYDTNKIEAVQESR